MRSEVKSAPDPAAANGEGFAPRFGPFSFTLTLVVCICALVFLAVAIVLWRQSLVSRQATVELLHERAANVVDEIETGVRMHLEPAIDLADFIAGQVESGYVRLDDRARLAALLTGALAATPHTASVVIFDPQYRMFGVRRDDGGNVALHELDQRDNPSVREAFAGVASADGAFWGEPVVTSDGIGIINLRRALRRDGELLGMLAVVITIPRLSELVTAAGDQFGATAFILYGRDRVLAHPFLATLRLSETPKSATAPLGEVGDIVLAGLWEGRAMRAFQEAGSGVEAVHLTLAGQDYVALYRWTGDFGAVPWALGAWFPMADIGAEMERLMDAFLGGIAVLVLALAAAVLLGRGIARPVRRVAAGAQRIGALDLAEVGRLPPSTIRELNDQARAFNTMLTSLRAFETYVPRKLVERLVREGEDRGIEPVERELTVIFTDIVGFTAMSEGLPAGEIASFLNHHFALLGACVEAEGGTVDKFIGDAVMAFWGAPEKQKDRAVRACRAALAMARALEADNAARAAAGEAPVRLRIGIHTGPVVVGNVGWPGRLNYTIVGDTVNTCQRLEALGKQMDRGDAVTILISGITAERLGEAFQVEPAGRFEVEGKSEPIEAYRLLGGPESPLPRGEG